MGFGFQKSQLDKVLTSPRHNEALTDDNLIELSYKNFRMVRQVLILLVFFLINLLSFYIRFKLKVSNQKFFWGAQILLMTILLI